MVAKTFKNNEVKIYEDKWDKIYGLVKNHFKGKKAGAFVTMHHGICLGIFTENGDFITPVTLPLEPKFLRSIRVFNQDSEAYIWKSSLDDKNIFRLRIRIDEEGEKGEIEAIEAHQLLWGTSLVDSEEKDWKLLKENRGIELRIHNSLIPAGTKVNTKERLWLITRNYIDYNELGQAVYVDCRFVRIEGGKGVV